MTIPNATAVAAHAVVAVEIEYSDNSAEFELNFNFYDYPTIVEAAKEFTDSCWIAIDGSRDGMSLSIRIEPKDENDSAKEAVDSFFNYMLGIMNRKMKGFTVSD